MIKKAKSILKNEIYDAVMGFNKKELKAFKAILVMAKNRLERELKSDLKLLARKKK